MAPEQIEGESIDRRVDIFAIGIVLYALTTGKHPFRRESDAATMYNICSPQQALAPRKFIPDYPETLENVLMKALAKNPAERFASANEMLRELDHALPASERANTDQDVADFVRKLVGDRLEERRNTLSEALIRADQSAIQRIPDVAMNPSSISVTAAEPSALTRPAGPPYHPRRRLDYARGGLFLVAAAGAGLALVSGEPPEPPVAQRLPVKVEPKPEPAPAATPPPDVATADASVDATPEPPATVLEPVPPQPRYPAPRAPRTTAQPPPPKPQRPAPWKHDPGF
jgi:serine/threonine-protein kinase